MKETLKIICDRDQDFEEVVKKAGDHNLDHSGWWYLHGKLEDLCGYDKAVIYNMSEADPDEYPETIKWHTIIGRKAQASSFQPIRRSKLQGIYPVEVYGVPEPCIGYFWVTEEQTLIATLDKDPNQKTSFPYWNQRGLVVLKSDIKENDYAFQKYKENSCNL